MVIDLNLICNETEALLYHELTDLSSEIILDQEIRVVILHGISGEMFPCKRVENLGVISRIYEDQEKNLLSVADIVANLDRPVISALTGDVVGHRLEIALACDIRIASEISCFGLPHIKNGLIPWDGGTQRLSRLIGKGKALEMILTGELIDAKEANRIGLVNKVVPLDQVMAVTMNMGQEMASKGPIALRYVKEAIHKGMDLTLEQGLHLEADLYLLIHTTKDREEGIQAFREKRKPRFEGK